MLGEIDNYMSCIKARLKWIFTLVWATLIGTLVAYEGLPPPSLFLAALMISFCGTAAVYIYNDAMEYELDKMNRVDRPIAQGKVSKNEALGLVLLLSVVAVFLAVSLNLQVLFLLGILLVLGFLYSTPSIYLKRAFPLKNIVPQTGASICTLIGGVAVGAMTAPLFYASALFFALCFALGSVSDLTDYGGDRVFGVKTIVVRYGPEFAMKLSATVALLISAIAVLTYSFFGLNSLAPILITASSLSLAWIFFSLGRNWRNTKYCLGMHRRIVLAITLFQISFFVGVLRLI